MSRNLLFPSIHGLVIPLSRLCSGIDLHAPILVKYTSLVLITSNKLKSEAVLIGREIQLQAIRPAQLSCIATPFCFGTVLMNRTKCVFRVSPSLAVHKALLSMPDSLQKYIVTSSHKRGESRSSASHMPFLFPKFYGRAKPCPRPLDRGPRRSAGQEKAFLWETYSCRVGGAVLRRKEMPYIGSLGLRRTGTSDCSIWPTESQS